MNLNGAFSLILFFIFTALASLHFYWALGMRWGFEKVIPRKNDGTFLFYPKKIESLAVGLLLGVSAIFYLILSGLTNISWNQDISFFFSYFIVIIFGIRAVGEFKYVGFTKRIRQNEFAFLDTYVYSPLCVFISILAFMAIREI